MEHKDDIHFYEFDCLEEPLPAGTPAPPRPAHRPRRITREIVPEAAVASELERFVLALLESKAVRKFSEDRKADITFVDACQFWGLTELTERGSGDRIDELLSAVVNNLRELNRVCTDASVLPESRRTLTPAEIRLLWNTFFYLEQHFQRHLDLVRRRKDGQ